MNHSGCRKSGATKARPRRTLALASSKVTLTFVFAGLFLAASAPVRGQAQAAIRRPAAATPGDQAAAHQASARGSWGDQGDGTYVNPVMPGDFSDLDAIRVGKEFYAISSTIQYAPGMAVLHSRDLVNWEMVGHVVGDLTTLDPELGASHMSRDGRGVWAGSIRFHQGRYWVYFGTPDQGIFVSTALRPEGPWASPKLALAATGWDDPCPFWDDDGKGYLVTSRFAADADGVKYRIHLFALTADAMGVVPASDRVMYQARGSEANKMYKVGGMYLHFFSEVRPEGRVVMMQRSKSLDGPWELRQLDHVHGAVDKEPNQGGLVQLENGSWWFVTHQGKGDWEGRAGVLLPVTWIDGWPILGEPGPDAMGEMVWGGAKPAVGSSIPGPPPTLFVDDDLRGKTLRPEWEWRYQPAPGMWSLTGEGLRLKALAPLPGMGFRGVKDVLTQRTARVAAAETTVRMELQGMVDGQEAGLAHFARSSKRLAVVQAAGKRRLVLLDDESRADGPEVSAGSVWLRSRWGVDGIAHFAYSLDGTAFTELGTPYRLAWASYRGDRVGLYTSAAPSGEDGKGSVEFRDFRYRVSRQPADSQAAAHTP